MKNLIVIITNNFSHHKNIASQKTWLIGNNSYLFLGEINIPELNMIGFPNDNGTSHYINHRIYDFIKKNNEYLKQWDWITFIDDDSYVFCDRLIKKLEFFNEELPILIGNSHRSNCDVFNLNNSWQENMSLTSDFNLKSGLSINKYFVLKLIEFIKSKDTKEELSIKRQILKENDLFSFLSQGYNVRKIDMKDFLDFSTYDHYEEVNINDCIIVGGLNSDEKLLIHNLE